MPNGNLSYRNNKSTISQRENSRMSSAGSHSPASSRSGSAKSLNFESRKREVSKIKEENYQMLQRLRAKKSHYNVSKWEDEDQQR
jgi:hypothetical protein